MFTPPSWRNPALCICTCQFLADVILSEGECPSRRTTTEPAFPSPAQRSFDPIFHADQSSPVRRQRESRACPELAEGLCASKNSHLQLHHRRPSSAFVLRRFAHRCHLRVLLQHLPQRLPQNPHSAAMHHPHQIGRAHV